MKWLITGGCGFVGSNLADHLLGSGADVSVLDNLQRVGSSENLAWLRARHGGGWQFLRSDVRDFDAVRRAVSELRPGAIAHLAGQVAASISMAQPRLDFEINALGTFNVLEAVRTTSPETIVLYSSTNKVYGSLTDLSSQEQETRYVLPGYPDGLDESLPLDGSTPYGCSKLAADQYVRDYFRMFQVPTVVFRHSSMYGSRQFATFDQGWVGWFAQEALRLSGAAAEPIRIAGDGKQVRDLLHSDDLIRCYTSAVCAIGECAGEVFNIGGGMANSLSLRELFGELGRRVGYGLRFVQTPWRPADQLVFVANVAKAKRLMRWAPEVPYSEGLDRMMTWVRSSREHAR